MDLFWLHLKPTTASSDTHPPSPGHTQQTLSEAPLTSEPLVKGQTMNLHANKGTAEEGK